MDWADPNVHLRRNKMLVSSTNLWIQSTRHRVFFTSPKIPMPNFSHPYPLQFPFISQRFWRSVVKITINWLLHGWQARRTSADTSGCPSSTAKSRLVRQRKNVGPIWFLENAIVKKHILPGVLSRRTFYGNHEYIKAQKSFQSYSLWQGAHRFPPRPGTPTWIGPILKATGVLLGLVQWIVIVLCFLFLSICR